MSIKIWPYKQGSRSARSLCSSLRDALPTSRCRVLLPEERSRWRGRLGDVVINWGNSSETDRFRSGVRIINPPSGIFQFSNKRNGYEAALIWADDFALPYTRSQTTAQHWAREGHKVVVRHKLTGHSGEGIEIIEPEHSVPSAPVYTLYLKKRREYRIHFIRVRDQARFLVQQKRRDSTVDDENVNWEIRNHSNGFIYAVDAVDLIDEEVFTQLKASILNMCRGLDFGAVDVVECNKRNGELSDSFRILEVNTACGIESPTVLDFYTQNLMRRITP